MFSKKNKYKILLLSVGIIGIIIFIWGYRNINTRFPESRVISAKQGQAAEYKEGVEVSTTKKIFLTEEQRNRIYELMGERPSFDAKILEVTVILENSTQEEKNISLTDLNIETLGWSTGIAKFIIDCTDEYADLEQILSPGETKQITLPYLILSTGFSKKEWKKIENRDFCLTYALYPIKRVLEFE